MAYKVVHTEKKKKMHTLRRFKGMELLELSMKSQAAVFYRKTINTIWEKSA